MSVRTETNRQRKYFPLLCIVKPQTSLLQAAAKSADMPGFKRDQASGQEGLSLLKAIKLSD